MAFLLGVAFSGDRFFYVNPLAFDGEYHFNRDDSLVRMPWFGCSCCPTNVVRVFPSLGGYIYGQRDDASEKGKECGEVFVNQFVSTTATLNSE